MPTGPVEILPNCAAPPKPEGSSPRATADSPSRDEAAELQRRWQLWRGAGFYPRHRDAAQGGGLVFPNQDRLDAARDTIASGGLLALVGPRGTGKTQLAACLAYENARHHGIGARYFRPNRYFNLIKSTFNGEPEDDPRPRAKRAGLLVLDECQERYESAFEDMELSDLLDERYGYSLPTILISNLLPDELAASIGASSSDRLRETGVIVKCDWPSFRRRAVSP